MKIFKIGISVLFISTFFCVSSFAWQKWSNRGIGNTISDYVHDIKAIANNDGRLELFAIQIQKNTLDVTLWHKWQRQSNVNQWSSWKPMGAPEGLDLAHSQQIATERNSTGEIEVFVKCWDGNIYNIYYKRQNGVYGGWYGWKNLENENERFSPRIGSKSNIGVYTYKRHMAVTVIDIYGNYWVKLRSSPYRQWSNWSSKGRPSATELTKKPMIGITTSDGKSFLPQYYALGEDGKMWNWAYYNHSFDRWESMGSPYNGISDGMDPIIAYNEDRRLEIFVLGNDNQFWKKYQIPGTYEWSKWVRLPGRTDKIRDEFLDVYDADVVQNKAGRLELFYVNSHGNIYHTYQQIPNSSWTGRWGNMGHPPNRDAKSITACSQLDGILFLFADVRADFFNNILNDNYPWYTHW